MSWSVNEVQTLAAKAARGAGIPPGQAAGFGRAALCHLVAGRDVSDLAAALEAAPNGPLLALPLAIGRVLEGAKDSEARGDILCDAPIDLMHSYAEALPFKVQAVATDTGINITITLDEPAVRHGVRRVEVPEELVAQMQALAARILVPESDASRLSGAGAGLTDND